MQISWLLQKPTDLDLHCLLRQAMSCSAREGLNTVDKKSSCNVWHALDRGLVKEEYLMIILG